MEKIARELELLNVLENNILFPILLNCNNCINQLKIRNWRVGQNNVLWNNSEILLYQWETKEICFLLNIN